MADLDLLKAGFSKIFSGDECANSIHDLVGKTYGIMGPPLPFDDEVCVFVHGVQGGITTIQTSKFNTITQLKAVLQKQSGIPMTQMRLLFQSKQLEDKCTLSDYGICNESTIFMVLRMTGGGPGQPAPSELRFNTAELDPTYDYDFSDVKDDGKKYMRGGYVYQRPHGWNRMAIKVVDRYQNNAWLGPNGIRTEEAQGEWPVSYHGTDISRANAILKKGLKPGPSALFGRGIYSSPSLEMVERLYAQQFTYKGKTYKIAFQNRVNPASLKVIPASQTGVEADYWLSANPGDVRPYGLIIKRG